jgi:MFS family permease
MVLQALAFLGFPAVTSPATLYAAALAFGYSYGAISTLFTAIVGDFFGRERAGTVVGVLFAMAGSMGGVGPLMAGAIHDARGSYGLAFALSAGLNLLAASLLLLCQPPRAARSPRARRAAAGDATLAPP